MTGMLISGNMSVGVRSSTTGKSRMMTRAITMNVYGLRSANRTIHIGLFLNAQYYGLDLAFGGLSPMPPGCLFVVYCVLDSPRQVFGYVPTLIRRIKNPND